VVSLFEPLTFKRGPAMKNRFMLAPLTNCQSHADGTLSDDEFDWLTMRARGGFGATMTCAANVSAAGQGYPGNLGAYDDRHIAGLRRLANGIRQYGSVPILQLFHAGAASRSDLTGQPRFAPWEDVAAGVRKMATDEVARMVGDFIEAAVRAQKAGFDGIELHGAHGYLLSAFLNADLNRRDDRYGGSALNRARPIRDAITGIRQRCAPQFSIGLRLVPERFGMELAATVDLARDVMSEGAIDYLDMSLWNVFKEPIEPRFQGRTLMSYFVELDRKDVRLGVAGNIMSTQDAQACMAAGVDFVLIGRGAIVHHDFPLRAQADGQFRAIQLPAEAAYLQRQGVSPPFFDYLGTLIERRIPQAVSGGTITKEIHE
jgi:2,4-dienoyl-CoA reductase-like NADH-dependent reductase (Old Yellow Enzyme family)